MSKIENREIDSQDLQAEMNNEKFRELIENDDVGDTSKRRWQRGKQIKEE